MTRRAGPPRSPWRRLAVVALAVATLAGAPFLFEAAKGLRPPVTVAEVHTKWAVQGGQPPAGTGEAAERLAPVVAGPPGGGPHSFVYLQPDGLTPVTYDPCRQIHVVVNSRTAPPGAEGLLAEALTNVAAATGLRFALDGPSDELPSAARPVYQRDRYGDRWAPVLVAWSDAAETPRLSRSAGLGGSEAITVPSGEKVYLTGFVTLDGPHLAGFLTHDGGHDLVVAIITHELGHVVGLNHVTDPGQLMFPESRLGVVKLGAGDLTGLAASGAGRCFPEI